MSKQTQKKEKLRWFKIAGIIEETRRIRWPKFKDVLAKTGLVLVFTAIFALFFALTNAAFVPLTQLFMK